MPISIPFSEVFCPNCEDAVVATEYIRTHEHFAGCPRCGLHFWTVRRINRPHKCKVRRYGRNWEVNVTRPCAVWKEIK